MKERGALLPILHLFLSLSVISVPTAGGLDLVQTEGEPHLVLVSLDAVLERGSTDYVRAVLRNDGTVYGITEKPQGNGYEDLAALEAGYELNCSDALGIVAQLSSRDGRVEVLSGPQLGGSLPEGVATKYPLEFAVRVDPEADVGVYPLELTLAYQTMSSVTVSGDPKSPEVLFYYENVSKTLPLEVEVVRGPEMGMAVEGRARPGEVSEVELEVLNQGDVGVTGVFLEIRPQAPLSGTGSARLGEIGPGGSASARFPLKAAEGTVPGEYPISARVTYMVGERLVKKDLAGLVEVEGKGLIGVLLPSTVVLFVVLAAAGLYVGAARINVRRRR